MVKFRKPKKLTSKKAEELLKPGKFEEKIEQPLTENGKEQNEETFFGNLSENENRLRTIYENCSDVIFRSFLIEEKVQAVLVYIEGLSNIEEIDISVLSPLMNNEKEQISDMNYLIRNRITVSKVKEIHAFSESVQEISLGNPVILVDKLDSGFSLRLSKSEKRDIEESPTEKVVRGPRESFIEALGVNTSLLRRRVRSPKLKIEGMEIGRYTKTNVALTYIEGLDNHGGWYFTCCKRSGRPGVYVHSFHPDCISASVFI